VEQVGSFNLQKKFANSFIVFLTYLLLYYKVWNVEEVEEVLIHHTFGFHPSYKPF